MRPQHRHRLLEHIDALRGDFEQLYRDCAEDLRRTEHLDKKVVQEQSNIPVMQRQQIICCFQHLQHFLLYLYCPTIKSMHPNLERLVEIHRSIVLSPRLENCDVVRELVYQYLMEVLYNHQRIYEDLLFDKPLTEEMMHAFDCRAIQVER